MMGSPTLTMLIRTWIMLSRDKHYSCHTLWKSIVPRPLCSTVSINSSPIIRHQLSFPIAADHTSRSHTSLKQILSLPSTNVSTWGHVPIIPSQSISSQQPQKQNKIEANLPFLDVDWDSCLLVRTMFIPNGRLMCCATIVNRANSIFYVLYGRAVAAGWLRSFDWFRESGEAAIANETTWVCLSMIPKWWHVASGLPAEDL